MFLHKRTSCNFWSSLDFIPQYNQCLPPTSMSLKWQWRWLIVIVTQRDLCLCSHVQTDGYWTRISDLPNTSPLPEPPGHQCKLSLPGSSIFFCVKVWNTWFHNFTSWWPCFFYVNFCVAFVARIDSVNVKNVLNYSWTGLEITKRCVCFFFLSGTFYYRNSAVFICTARTCVSRRQSQSAEHCLNSDWTKYNK